MRFLNHGTASEKPRRSLSFTLSSSGQADQKVWRLACTSSTRTSIVLSGIVERHPKLKVYVSHTAGAVPYQSARLDKNGKGAKLPLPPAPI